MADENPDKKTDVATSPGVAESEAQAPDPEGVNWFKENSIPIAGVILVALIICLVSRYNWVTLARVKDLADTLKNFVEIIAVAVGGWWAIFRFRIGREFQESLIPVV